MQVKMLIMDVDGTLTDGGIYIGSDGEVFKRFNAKDGYAIANILPNYIITPVVLTGRKSKIVENRCKELGIEKLIQGCSDKFAVLQSIIRQEECAIEDIAYIGDDLNDLECMKVCGVRGCPADACKEIIEISDFISTKNGGQGAVREFIEWIVNGYENSSISSN